MCGKITNQITSNWNNSTINSYININNTSKFNNNSNNISISINSSSSSTYPSMQWGRGTSLFYSPLRDRGG
jgi:hypothetical protein